MKPLIILCLCCVMFQNTSIAQKETKKISFEPQIGMGLFQTTWRSYGVPVVGTTINYNHSSSLSFGIEGKVFLFGLRKDRYDECRCFGYMGVQTKYKFDKLFTQFGVGKVQNFKAYNVYEWSIVQWNTSTFRVDDSFYPYGSLMIGTTILKKIQVGIQYLTTAKFSGEVQVHFPAQTYVLEKDFRYQHLHLVLGYLF